MNIKDWLIPDEVQSASLAGAKLVSVAKGTSHFWLKQFVGLFIPFGVGCVAALLIVDEIIAPENMAGLREVVVGVLTFVSVLAGFMVTLMLFTGRTEGTRSLTFDEAPVYVEKVTYLLFSQAVTLALQIACSLLCIGWLVADAIGANPALSTWLLVFSLGLLAVSLFRALLLPLQIYEVHHFELSSMVEEKREELKRRLEAQRNAGGSS